MASVKHDSREKLIRAAQKATYQQGFAQTSLADIAKAAGVPLGNVYYYFKTKEALGEAVIDARLSYIHRAHDSWEQSSSPADRLCAFVDSVLDNKEALARGGCSIGTLCSELSKARGPLARKASELLKQHLLWIQEQFSLLGRNTDAHSLAIHLLAGLQGVGVLAHSLGDADLVVTETRRLREWIRSL